MFLINPMYQATFVTLQIYCKIYYILIFGDDPRYKPDGEFSILIYNVDNNITYHMLLL